MSFRKFVLCAASFLAVLATSSALKCYQCNGSDPSKPFQCNEWLNSDIDIKPEPCDEVYGAKHCIKHTGRFEGYSISCYQCSASENIACSDTMIHMGGIEPGSCDQVFEAQYCIKSLSLDGGIGTKRYCSSLDLGNYCNYVKQPGDTLTYRSCVYTCSGDGCNPAPSRKPTLYVVIFTILMGFLGMRFRIVLS